MRWITVNESLPPRGQDVLVWGTEGITVASRSPSAYGGADAWVPTMVSGQGDWDWEYDSPVSIITHWAPLPPEPNV